jgi:hypothetical protein
MKNAATFTAETLVGFQLAARHYMPENKTRKVTKISDYNFRRPLFPCNEI